MIRVNDDYVILVDPLNYTPCRDPHSVDKKGNPVYKSIGYYSTLEQALRGVVDDMNSRAFEQNTYSLKEALEVIKQSNKVFTDLMREILNSGELTEN